MTVPQTCFWCPWQLWGILVRYFVECPSVRIIYHFLISTLGLYVLDMGPQKYCAILITSCQGYIFSKWLINLQSRIYLFICKTILISSHILYVKKPSLKCVINMLIKYFVHKLRITKLNSEISNCYISFFAHC